MVQGYANFKDILSIIESGFMGMVFQQFSTFSAFMGMIFNKLPGFMGILCGNNSSDPVETLL